MVDLMKSMFLGIGLLWVFCAQSQEVEKLTFVEKFRQEENPTLTSILPEEQHLSGGHPMHYDLETGTEQIRVDEVTPKLLHAIGRNLKESKDVEIIGEGIDENGRTSAYEGHTFSLRNHLGGTVANACWKYTLPLANGGDTIVSMSENSLVFSIGPVNDGSKYKINVNGDICGKVSFTGSINGETVGDTYNLSLDLKPHINKVNIISKKESQLVDYYDLSFVVEYTGTNMITVSIEEEYSSKLRSLSVYEPFLAHVYIPAITSFHSAWIDIEAENKYGKDTYTVELPPFEGNDGDATMSERLISCDSPYYTGVDVFDVNKNRFYRMRDLKDLQTFPAGLYIIKYYQGEECIKTVKYLKR